MARALLITNPVAARTKVGRTAAVSRVFRAARWQVDLAETVGPGDARRLAVLGVASGVDAVVVFGGDGTTMQAAAALIGTEVPLGLIPGGTGNLLAGNLRISSRPVLAAQTVTRGHCRRIDLGRLERADGVHYFAVGCGAGADARVMGETRAAAKRRWGLGGYVATLLKALPEIRSSRCEITVDGRRFEAPAAVTLVLNCGEVIPPVLRVGADVALDDGMLDLIALAADTPWQCIRGVWRVLQNVVLGTGPTAYLASARGCEITIVSEQVQPVQFDGDVAGTTPVTVTVAPGALRVMVPA